MPSSPNVLPLYRPDLGSYAVDFNAQFGLEMLIGLQIMPEFPVPNDAGRFFTLSQAESRRKHVIKHASGAGFTRIARTMDLANYDCEDMGLEMVADKKRQARYANVVDFQYEDAITLDYTLRLEHEVRVAATVQDTVAFPPTGVGFDWRVRSGAGMAHPRADIEASYDRLRAKTQIKQEQLSLILPYDRWKDLTNNADVLDATKYTVAGVGAVIGTDEVRRRVLADYLGIKEILVGMSSFDTAPEGGTAVFSDVWNYRYGMLTKLVPTGSQIAPRWTPGFGRTLRWDFQMPTFLTMETYYQPLTDEWVTRARQFTDEFALAQDGIYADLMDMTLG